MWNKSLQIQALCNQSLTRALSRREHRERPAAAPSYTGHFEFKLCARLLDNHVGFLRMKAMIASM